MPQDTHTPNADPDLRKTYDAIVVGSGAAGGMAAHVLTSHGMQVLMLEAGKKLPIEQELKSMQWPYDHPRRQRGQQALHRESAEVAGVGLEHQHGRHLHP